MSRESHEEGSMAANAQGTSEPPPSAGPHGIVDPASDERRSIFSSPSFRMLFLAWAFSRSGTHLSYLVVPLVAVLALDASPGQVGLLGALTTGAILMIGLPAGAWVDRLRRRRVMIVAELTRAALLGSVPVAWWLDFLTINQLYLVVFLSGFATVFFDVSAQTFLPHVVGRNRLVDANTKLASWEASASVAGPGVGGYLVQWLTAPVTVALSAVGYLWAALCLLAIRKPEPVPERRGERHLIREIREGTRFVLQHPLLRPIAVMGATVNLAISMTVVIMPIVFREKGMTAGELGLLIAVAGIGGIVGATTGRRAAAWLGHGRILWISGLTVVPFGFAVPFIAPGIMQWLVALALLVIGYRVGMNNVLLVSFRQSVTPQRLLGRVNATMRLVITGSPALGAGLAGLLGELIGITAPLWAAATCLALAWLPVYFSPLRTMRSLPATPAEED